MKNLNFKKDSLVELNPQMAQDVNSGVGFTITTTVFSSPACIIVGGAGLIIAGTIIYTNMD